MAARNETAERPSAILVYDMIPIRLIAKVYAAPNLPKCLVPVLMCCTKLIEVSGTGMKGCAGTGGTGIHVVLNLTKWYWCCTELTEVSGTGINAVPSLPKYPVPVLMSYRTYRSVRYRYYWRYVPAVCLGTYRAEDTIGILTGDIDYQTVIFNINVWHRCLTYSIARW